MTLSQGPRKGKQISEGVLSELLANRRYIDILEHNMVAESALAEVVITRSRISDHIRGKGLHIVTAKQSKSSFIVGSRSFARAVLYGELDPIDPEGYLWFPISQDVVVSPVGRPSREEVSAAKTSFVRTLNEAMFDQSTVIAGRARALVESLARRLPVPIS